MFDVFHIRSVMTAALVAIMPFSASAQDVPMTKFQQETRDSLPSNIKEAGKLRLVSIIFPPYAYLQEDGKTFQGLNVDMAEQLKSILGIDVTFETAPSLADITTGFSSGRYDVSISPTSDIPETEKTFDFVDWLAEYVVFLVPAGNPKGITSLETTCGKKIATLKGGTAEKVLVKASENCVANGSEKVQISIFSDQNTAVLSVKSGRTDAAFSSQIPLSYYVKQNGGSLELAGVNQLNGFPKFWIGGFMPKGSPLPPVMLASFKAMKDSGAYDALLKKYDIQQNAIETFGINLATAK